MKRILFNTVYSKFKDIYSFETRKLESLRVSLEEGELEELKIKKEEKEIKNKLNKKVEHRDYKAVKNNIRLRKKELKKLHSQIIELMSLIKQCEAMPAGKNLTTQRDKDEFKKLEKYYLLQIYKILRAYERIFRHLWRKENILGN